MGWGGEWYACIEFKLSENPSAHCPNCTRKVDAEGVDTGGDKSTHPLLQRLLEPGTVRHPDPTQPSSPKRYEIITDPQTTSAVVDGECEEVFYYDQTLKTMGIQSGKLHGPQIKKINACF